MEYNTPARKQQKSQHSPDRNQTVPRPPSPKPPTPLRNGSNYKRTKTIHDGSSARKSLDFDNDTPRPQERSGKSDHETEEQHDAPPRVSTRVHKSLLEPTGLNAIPIAESVIKYLRMQAMFDVTPQMPQKKTQLVGSPRRQMNASGYVIKSHSGEYKYITTPQPGTSATRHDVTGNLSGVKSSAENTRTQFVNESTLNALEKSLTEIRSSRVITSSSAKLEEYGEAPVISVSVKQDPSPEQLEKLQEVLESLEDEGAAIEEERPLVLLYRASESDRAESLVKLSTDTSIFLMSAACMFFLLLIYFYFSYRLSYPPCVQEMP